MIADKIGFKLAHMFVERFLPFALCCVCARRFECVRQAADHKIILFAHFNADASWKVGDEAVFDAIDAFRLIGVRIVVRENVEDHAA